MLQAVSSRRPCHRDADQVRGGSENEEPFDQAAAAMPGLTRAARGLDPAEWLLDPLALVLAHRIAGMAGGCGDDRQAAVDGDLRDVGHAAGAAAVGDERGGVLILVPADRAAGRGGGGDHGQRRLAFSRAVGLAQAGIDVSAAS